MIFHKKGNNQQGAIMVEAAIYVPLVMLVILMLLYYGLFMMQKYMMMYEANRVAIVVAREEAYLGYEQFDMGADNEIDFDWGESSQPSSSQISAYYNTYNDKIGNIYREVSGIISVITNSQIEDHRLADAGREAVFLALGTMQDADISVDRSIFGTTVTVDIEYKLPAPAVIQYLTSFSSTSSKLTQLTLKSSAYSYSVNGSSVVRNVDLATDLFTYLMKKLGFEENMNTFLEKVNGVLDKIL